MSDDDYRSELKRFNANESKSKPPPDTLSEKPATVPPSFSPLPLGQILERVAVFFRRFVRFNSDLQVYAVALWVAHTHAIEAADTTPYLWPNAPERRSGKSRALEVAELLVARPWMVTNPSEAVIFRKIDKHQPTVLWDEIDNVFKHRDAGNLRALINSGFRRGVRVPRSNEKGDLQEFNVFSAKAIAGIGGLPDTVADRCIPIRLARRKRSAEPVEKLRLRDEREPAAGLRKHIEAWSQGAVKELAAARPEFPSGLSDRAEDVWEPLFAIADMAGSPWPERARTAAVALCGEGEGIGDNESIGVQLLADIRTVFDRLETDRVFTANLVAALREHGEGPWAAWWSEHEERDDYKAAGHRLATLLRRYEITSKQVRIGTDTRKGYVASMFADAWERYLPSTAQEGNKETSQVKGRFPESGPDRHLAPEQGGSVVSFSAPEEGETGLSNV